MLILWQMHTKIDLEQLRIEIRQLNRTKKLYRVLKEELGKLDHWKMRARGDPVKAHAARGEHGSQKDF